MSERRESLPTLIGLPSLRAPDAEAEPFPLQPYRDAVSYTPSHERPKRHYESTPVYIPPARVDPRRITAKPLDHTRAMLRPSLAPSRVAQCMAVAIVCYVTAMVIASMF